MIDVHIYEAKRNLSLGKNATFLEGELYLGRYSKDCRKYVIRSEEGYWIVLHDLGFTYNRTKVDDYFTRKGTVYMKNRKRLNEILDVKKYLESDQIKKRWYSYYEDIKLYS